MRIATAIFPFYAIGHHPPRGSSKKPVLSLSKCLPEASRREGCLLPLRPEGPALRQLEGRHLCFMRGAYKKYVNTEQWRERR